MRSRAFTSGTITCMTVAAALALAGCDDGPSEPAMHHDHITDVQPDRSRADRHSGVTRVELARLRAGTARYQRIEEALADGYVAIDVFLPGMGFHFLNPALLDDTFEPHRPELLVYWPEENGRMRLVAVEYAVPLALAPDSPPEGFTGSGDVWFRDENFQLWTLHAWVWLDNPDGIFAPFNPRLE